MWKLAVRQTLAHRGRLALTLFAVLLGVTLVTGSLVLVDTSMKLIDDQFRTAAAEADLTVRSSAAFDEAMGVEVERDPVPADLSDRVRSVAGVAVVQPIARGSGIIEVDGEAIVPTGASLLMSWASPPFGAFTVRSGRAPAAGEVAVDVRTARQYGIEVGETVTVRAVTSAPLRVVGLVGLGGLDGLPNGTVALVDLATARELLALGDRATELSVDVADGADVADVRERLAGELGPTYSVTASTDVAAASAAAAKTQLGYLSLMLLALAAAALLVGAFLIANTFSIMIAQRTRELALLRAAGATDRQILGNVLGEALVVGLIAAVAGVALGVGTGAALRGLVGAFGISVPSGGVVVAPRTVLVGLVVGAGVTVLAALGPARRAARVAPVAALRDSSGGVAVGRTRVVVGAILSALGVAALIAGGATALVLGAVAVVTGFALLGPAVAATLARVVGRPLDLAGVAGRLARRSAARAPRRTAATAMALAIGLALMAFMGVVAQSVKDSVASSYTETVTADVVVQSSRNEMLGGLPADLAPRLAALPEVDVASPMRYGHWKDVGVTRALAAVDPVTLPEVASVRMVAGDLAALADGGVVLADYTARQRGVGVGDYVTMTFARTGTQRLPVVGLMRDRDAQALSTDYFISLSTYSRHFVENVDASIFVAYADGIEPAAGRSALESALAGAPTAELRDQAAAVAARTLMVDQILGLVSALLLFAVAIAALGITNTLALSIVERRREIGLLRAVGTTRGQVRWMVRLEAVLVAVLATAVGLGLGLGIGAVTVGTIGEAVAMPVVVPWGQLVLVAAVAVVAGLGAGLLPARRAARLDILAAITAP
ncbi:MAG: ABC transporter permease [Micromonosporaceae bacterium]|nr:ABC transporter permease [Micromonosporaceae bacterium]